MSAELLKIDHLRVDLISVRGVYHTVRDVSLSLNEGEILGVVGESGCGKTMCILRIPTYGFAKQNGRDAERAD